MALWDFDAKAAERQVASRVGRGETQEEERRRDLGLGARQEKKLLCAVTWRERKCHVAKGCGRSREGRFFLHPARASVGAGTV